jgi:tRNA(fMet)-specific endonuclease VapC
VKYLLDTNACIALINGKPTSVRVRFGKVVEAGAQVLVPSVVAFELWYGVAKSANPEMNARRVREFFAGPVRTLPFEEDDARSAGNVRATLEQVGKPIGAYDVLIAGQALRHELTLVTANAREFGRVKGLDWEDWGRG